MLSVESGKCYSAPAVDTNALQFAPIYQKNMVLQRDKKLFIRGKAKANQLVTVKIGDVSVDTTSNDTGFFIAVFPPQQWTSSTTLSAICGDESIVIPDVAIGDVFLVSGQSNMALKLRECRPDHTSLKYDDIKNISFIDIQISSFYGSQETFSGIWEKASLQNIADKSGLGLFFAAEISKKTRIPTGIVNVSLGGMNIESFVSRESLAEIPEYSSELAKYEADMASVPCPSELPDNNTLIHNGIRELFPEIPDTSKICPEFCTPDFDDNNWEKMLLPDSWTQAGCNHAGIFRFRKQLTLPDIDGSSARLHLGAIDKADKVYFNGVLIGETGNMREYDHWNTLRVYDVPASLIKNENIIAVEAASLVSIATDGGLTGPAEEMYVQYGRTRFPLAGEWKFCSIYNAGTIGMTFMRTLGNGAPGSFHMIYDNCIYPLRDTAFCGIIFYQGEANAICTTDTYQRLLQKLIREWRELFHDKNLSFSIIQLPDYSTPHLFAPFSQWAKIREAQYLAAKEEKCNCIVTLGTGDITEIHPVNKKLVAQKAADHILAEICHTPAPAAPSLVNLCSKDNSLVLTFDEDICDTKEIYFAIGNAKGETAAAEVTFCSKNSILLHSPAIDSPCNVWYAWADNPTGANLQSTSGIPASPFRASVTGGVPESKKMIHKKNKHTPCWIWADVPVQPHSICEFRKTFNAPAQPVTINISAESDFILYIDNREIYRGQYQDYPEYKRFHRFDTTLEYSGDHLVAVEVYFNGRNFQTSVAAETPGLFLEITFADGKKIASDTSFKSRQSISLLHDRLDRVNPQVGMVFTFDLSLADRWKELDYDDSSWQDSIVIDKDSPPLPAPVNQLEFLPEVSAVKIGEYTFARESDRGSYAEICAKDNYDSSCPDGIASVYDLGSEYLGYLKIVFDAPHRCIADISHSEHLTGGKVASRVGERNFTDRLILSGKGEFILPRRVGCRYIQVSLTAAKADVGIRFCPVELPLAPAAEISSDTPDDAILWQASLKTLILCMAEHYMDCPWREQALYGFDSRSQMLFGYGIWDNSDYVRHNLALLARSVLTNGLMAISSPCNMDPQIPLFSMIFASALRDWCFFNGKNDALKDNARELSKIEKTLTANFDQSSGLYLTPSHPGVWNFYEWQQGLDGLSSNGDCTDFSHLDGKPQLDVMYNLFMIDFFDAMAFLRGGEYAVKRDALKTAVFSSFYDQRSGCLKTVPDADVFHESVQILALYTDCVPQELRSVVWQNIINGKGKPATLSMLCYLVETAMREKGDLRNSVLEYVESRLFQTFMPMLETGDTLWETADGAEAFDNAGSLCHGWSSVFARFFQNCILGVTVTSPGGSQITVAPWPGKRKWASGEVRTARGIVKISWDREKSSLCLQVPQGTEVFIPQATKQIFTDIDIK